MKMYFLPVLMLLTSCAMSLSPTGEPGISMGDSYEKVLAKLQTNHVITKEIAGEGIRAEGYSSMLNSCRVKYFIFHISYFIFQGKDGLQQVSYEPAPHLSVSNQCQ